MIIAANMPHQVNRSYKAWHEVLQRSIPYFVLREASRDEYLAYMNGNDHPWSPEEVTGAMRFLASGEYVWFYEVSVD